MTAACLHCGAPSPEGQTFCCQGCETAYALVCGLGLEEYYRRRSLDPDALQMRPGGSDAEDVSALVVAENDGVNVLHLMVEGVQCAACVWLIESVLTRRPGVVSARMNMTSRRLTLRWSGKAEEASGIVAPIRALGYRLAPYNPKRLDHGARQTEKELLRCMAVAGFAAANIMLFSVSVWSGAEMGSANRSLFHWLSALIAFPAVAYAFRPFARSAWDALRHGRTNMDVPITLAIVLSALTSLWETARGGPYAYFDASTMLLFFLLTGRYLDSRARGRARSAAEHLLALAARAVTVERPDGSRVALPVRSVAKGDVVLVAAGERIGVDGTVLKGTSDVDISLLSGETTPQTVTDAGAVFAGTLNLTGPLRLKVAAVGEDTLLAEITRLTEAAEQGRAHIVVLADRVARLYAPVVHLAALFSFLGWTLFTPLPWQEAVMIAVAVLIITCPCALALAVPAVQVIASGRLLRQGILLKSATALERLARVDAVVFDKTGTLTLGDLRLIDQGAAWTEDDLRRAASLAAVSKHPLARALAAARPVQPADGVAEHPGQGLAWKGWRLGSAAFCGVEEDAPDDGPGLWLSHPSRPPIRFAFIDRLRPDARDAVSRLTALGLSVEALSGDRPVAVESVARAIGIQTWSAACSPAQKVSRLESLHASGATALMVGDGLNDAPALAAASVSMSPSNAADIAQTAADIVFQGERLLPVVETLIVARQANLLVRQNFALSILYNLVAVPLAVAGWVTPLIAAVAMSSSSLMVILNALRLTRRKPLQ